MLSYYFAGMGRPPRLTDQEVLRLVTLHPEPVVSASDLCEKMDMTQRGANKRLQRLVDAGFLQKKEVGSSAMVFWITQDGKGELSDLF